MKRPLPRSLAVAVLASTASCGSPQPEKDAGTPDGGAADAGMLCANGCFVLIRDGGPVFYEDGGPYCLC